MTCYRTLPPGETLDFMLAGHEFGIPHAPGYPLLTIIGTVTSVFPGWLFGMEYTFQMNMVMCAISSLANVVLFYLVKYITGHTSAGIMARVRSKFELNGLIWSNLGSHVLKNHLGDFKWLRDSKLGYPTIQGFRGLS